MPAVGVVGKDGKQIADIFLRMAGGKVCCYHITDRQPIGPCVTVLVAAQASPVLAGMVPRLKKGSFLIVNADDKKIFPLLSQSEATLITYGFNSKTCVTASSISEDGVQVCIQRTFTDESGGICLPQEFFVKASGGPRLVLAAATAWAVCGLQTK